MSEGWNVRTLPARGAATSLQTALQCLANAGHQHVMPIWPGSIVGRRHPCGVGCPRSALTESQQKVRADVGAVLEAARPMEGFILSSACSVAPPAPPDNLKRMVEICREFEA